MISMEINALVKDSARRLIDCGDDYFVMKQSIDKLYGLFCLITEIDIHHLNEGDIHLPSGKAISPSGAAHCLLEMKRTAIFLRGIKQAIDLKVDNGKTMVRILYAGCGPYASLITPLLYDYSVDAVRVTFLDINPVSLNASEKLLNELGLGGFVEKFVLADATTYKVDLPYDLVISETMQAGLKNEPQVQIFQKLIPQCNADTIFIPEQIIIDVYLLKRGIWAGEQLIEQGGETDHLCQLFTVSKASLDSSSYRKVVTLPQTFNKPYDLLLYTTIKVFDNKVLGLNDCSLNMPIRYFELRNNYPKSIEFWYNQSDKPRIESKVLDYIT